MKIAWMFPLLLVTVASAAPNAPPPTPQSEPHYYYKPASPDEAAALAIYRAFYDDGRVVSAFTMVDVTNGVATLTGSVPTPQGRAAAEEIAARMPGISRVVNLLTVVPPAPPHLDEEIYNNIRHAIATDPQVNRYRVLVGVMQGRVYLAGPVDTVWARAKIANLAGAVPGVVSVANALTVEIGSQRYDGWTPGGIYPRSKRPSDAQVKKDINQQLQSTPMVQANNINVNVNKGVATLTGKVTSEEERQAAIHTAYTGGAKDVRDQLQVVPPPNPG